MASFERKSAAFSQMRKNQRDESDDESSNNWTRLTPKQKDAFIALGVGPISFAHMFNCLNEYRICYGPKATVFCIRQKNHASKLKNKQYAEVFTHFKFWVTDKSIEPFQELEYLEACYDTNLLLGFLEDFDFDVRRTAKRTQDPDEEIRKLEAKLAALNKMKRLSSVANSETEFFDDSHPKKHQHLDDQPKLSLSQRLEVDKEKKLGFKRLEQVD